MVLDPHELVRERLSKALAPSSIGFRRLQSIAVIDNADGSPATEEQVERAIGELGPGSA